MLRWYMALVIWTGTDAQMLKTVIGPVVSQNTVTHRVVPNMTQFPPAGEGDVVLACGSKALALLQGMGLAPKNRTITSLRERPLKHNGAWIFMTFDPSITQREYVRLPEIQWDIQLAIRMHETRSVKPKIGEYRYVESLHELIERIEEKYEATKKPVDVACDLETKSLNPYDPKAWIIAASFTVDEGKSDVLYFERGETPLEPLPWKPEEEMTYWEGLWTQIHWILTTNKVSIRGANFKYDSNWIYQKWKIYCTNHKFDTMLVGSLLDENRCVAPETLILTSDLRWVRADSLQSGDSVVGFDEHGDQGIHRRMRKSLVSSSEVIKKRRLKLNLSNGHSIVVSDNHQFLCKKYPSTHVKVWRKAKNIQPGCVIFSATPHPKDIQGEASDYELGRLSGFLDGEGSVPKLNDFGSWHLGWGQIPHAAHQDMKRVASLIKAEYREHDDNLNLCKSVVFKGAWNSLHALIATRPPRLVAKEPWDNGPLPRGDEAVSVSVLSVEDLGVGPVVALETTTHTFIAEGLLSHNSNSLKLHAKLMTPMGGYEDDMDKYDFSCLEVVPKPEMLNYVGGDTDVTYRVAQVMKRDILKDKKLSNFYVKLLHPASKAFEKLERNGVLIDQAYFQQLKSELETEIARLQQEMLTCMPHKLRIKYKDDIEQSMADGKSPFKAKILSEFLFSPAGLNLKPQVFTEKTRVPSTSMDHLMMFEGDPVAANFISRFRELGSASKTLSTFVVGFLKHLRQDGRFHGTYMLHRGDYGSDDSGTTTGRTSCKDPALQTIPKHSKWAKRLRKAYIAPPGKVILQCDFSQGELRIAAVIAGEPTMIKAYASGADLHAITAAQLNGYSYEDFMLLPEDDRDALRSGGKAGNFGLIYGMQHRGFKEYAYTTYGVSMTEEEAFQKREAFFALYGRLLDWHEEYKGLAHRWGFVRSPLGRVRHLPLINSKDREIVAQSERQAINSPIQSCLSDMMQLAMVHVDREYGDAVEMFMMTHDSLALYVPEDDAVEWAKRVKSIMENLPLKEDFGWDSPLKFIADAEIGQNMADLKKLKGL